MEEICVIIKAPNQEYDDIKVNCQLSWTILQLKEYLSKEYPSKPKTTDQRLIYSGHLLKDEQLLENIIELTGDNNLFTFHLVCHQKYNFVGDSIPVTSNSPPNDMPTRNMGGFSPFLSNDLNNSLGSNPELLQQSYNLLMNQYYQYMSYYYSSSPPLFDYASYTALSNAYMQSVTSNFTNQQAPISNTTNENNAANVNENRPNQNPANNRNNNQGENEENNRGWIDYLYSFSKAIVMFSIIYFYSSPNRLILLMFIGLILYLYKNMHGLPNANNDNNLNNNNNNENVQQENNEANLNNQSENLQDSVDENISGASTEDSTTQENSRFSGLRFVWVFVTSLFTSLIPDAAPIN